MRWTVTSIFVAIALIVIGFFVWGGDNMDISEKCTYWLVVVGFLFAEGFRALEWLHDHDL